MSIHSSNPSIHPSRSIPSQSDSIHQQSSNQAHLNLKHQIEEDHRFGGTHWLPLLFAFIPILASIIHGDPQSWTDPLLLILIGFILYKLTKVPWQIYASARTHRIINQIHQSDFDSSTLKPSLDPLPDLLGYSTELERFESISLFIAILSPSFGIFLLNLIQSILNTSITLDYLNSKTTLLFLLSSLIKPIGHLIRLLFNRINYLQTKLHFPSDLLNELKTISNELKDRLDKLESKSISSYELSLLKTNYLETPIARLTKTLTKQLESDEKRKLQITEECNELNKTLNRLENQLIKSKLDLNSLILEQEQIKSNPIHTIAQMIIQLITVTQQTEDKIKSKVENRFENLDQSDDSQSDEPDDHLNQNKVNNIQSKTHDLKKITREVEFIPTPKISRDSIPIEKKPKMEIQQWVLYYLTIPILISIKLIKTMILFPIELISNIIKGEEYQRLSERNYQIDKASYLNHQTRPTWFEANSINQTISPFNELSSTFKSQFNLHHHSHSNLNSNHQLGNHLDEIKEVIEEENL